MNDDGRRPDWGGEHTVQYTHDILQNFTPETYNLIKQCHPNEFDK